MLILMLLLIATLLVSFTLQRFRVRLIHDSVIAVLFGACAGLAIRVWQADAIRRLVEFDHRLFFNLLLPPIILNSGYDLQPARYRFKFGFY